MSEEVDEVGVAGPRAVLLRRLAHFWSETTQQRVISKLAGQLKTHHCENETPAGHARVRVPAVAEERAGQAAGAVPVVAVQRRDRNHGTGDVERGVFGPVGVHGEHGILGPPVGLLGEQPAHGRLAV